MSSLVQVAIHASQFPENVRRDLLESLRTRRVNHKFHYDSVKQTQQWLALHQAYSPSRTDADCAATYDRSFAAVAARIDSPARAPHRPGLRRRAEGHAAAEAAAGFGQESVLHALGCQHGDGASWRGRRPRRWLPPEDCFPLVCDLASADDLPAVLEALPVPDAARLITFFGMIPNFEPQVILPRLAGLLRPGDYLLFSANLAPGRRLRRRRATNPAALRQCPDPRLADDVPAGPRRGGKRWRTPL